MKWIIFLLLIIIFIVSGCTNKQDTTVEAIETSNFETKTSEGEITIDLTPTKYENGIFIVGFGINTHSIELGKLDLQKQVTLSFNGQDYSPAENPELTGHHASGELKFQLPEKPDRFEIIIMNVPDVEERRLSWN